MGVIFTHAQPKSGQSWKIAPNPNTSQRNYYVFVGLLHDIIEAAAVAGFFGGVGFFEGVVCFL